jgi:hypothetical protein
LSKHRLAVVVAVTLLLTACGKGNEDPPATAATAPSAAVASPGSTAGIASPAPAASGRPEIVKNPDGTVNSGGPRPATSESALTAGGLGPYTVGAAHRDLAAAGLVGAGRKETSGNCPGYVTATGAGRHHSPGLVFYRGRLLRLSVTSGAVATDTEVTIGMPLAEVKRRYPAGQQIDDWTGRPAWLATTGDYGLLFEMQDGKVSVMQAGMAEPMRFRYTDNQGC